MLINIWSLRIYSIKTKIRLCNTNVKTVLLFGGSMRNSGDESSRSEQFWNLKQKNRYDKTICFEGVKKTLPGERWTEIHKVEDVQKITQRRAIIRRAG